MLRCIEQSEEAGHKAIVGKVVAQLVVYVHESVVEARFQPQSHAQHGAHLGCAKCRADAMTCRIAHQQKQAILIELHEVVQVAAGLVCRFERAGESVAVNRRHFLG